MIQRRKLPIYARIALEIGDKINKGFFVEAGKLPSQKELCRKYNIGDMTAVKVHNELEKMGLAYKVQGKGVFACSKNRDNKIDKRILSNPVRKIVFFSYEDCLSRQSHYVHKIFSGVQKRAFELGLNIRTELFSSETQGSFQISDDEALIIPYRVGCEWLLPVIKLKRIRCVLIDNYFSEAYCVLNDNYSGISLIMDHLETKGARSFIFATKHFAAQGQANLSERRYAFVNECKRRNLKYKVMENGNFNELLEVLKSTEGRPDSVMFSTDAAAVKFKNMLADAKTIKKHPFITGFDGWYADKETEDITTVKVDYEGMGIAAVDVMLSNFLEDWNLPDIVRVPCELLAKD